MPPRPNQGTRDAPVGMSQVGGPRASPYRASSSKPSNQRSKPILYLEQNHAKFNAPSKKESVFFDECNREIINVTSGYEQTNKTCVVFQRTDLNCRVEFHLPIEKRILSIKLNSAWSVLAYHVERNIIEFINVHEQVDSDDGSLKHVLDTKRYVQSSRAKNSKLIGFLWTGAYDLVIITDFSVEFYHLDAPRHRLSHIKMFQSATNWFVYQPHITRSQDSPDDTYSVLMVSTGSLGNSMQPYMFRRSRIVRLQRFEVEGSWHDSEKLELFERSITIAHIYGYARLLVLQHESLNVKSKGAQIVIYTVDPISGLTTKSHTLDLDVSGRFAINVLDNLVVAHNQPTKSSFVFDIMIKSTEKSDHPDHFVSLLDSRPIKQLQIDNGASSVDMYSLNWVFFQPHFIVEAKLGLLTILKLDLQAINDIFQDNNVILSFLAHRENSSEIILKKCKQIVADAYKQATSERNHMISPLAQVSSTFEHLGKLVVSAGPKQVEEILPAQIESNGNFTIEPSINQADIQREVLSQLECEYIAEPARYHFASSAMLEFIFVVRRHGKNVDPCIYEQLLKLMLESGRHFQVIQLVRGGVFKNSEKLVYSMLSVQDQYWLSSSITS